MKIYNKLVRDHIPDIIASDGQTCKTHILSDDEYVTALETKLDEEVAEYHADKTVEELIDILEVIHAIGITKGYTLDDMIAMKNEKAHKKGNFFKKIYLESIE